MKVKNKARLRAMEDIKGAGESLCKIFNRRQSLPAGWQIEFYPGRPISDYNGGGHRYNYDAVVVRIPEGQEHAGCLRKEVCFPAALDVCSRYTDAPDSKWATRSWAEVLVAACWELREWILEIGIPGARESDLSSMLSD